MNWQKTVMKVLIKLLKYNMFYHFIQTKILLYHTGLINYISLIKELGKNWAGTGQELGRNWGGTGK